MWSEFYPYNESNELSENYRNILLELSEKNGILPEINPFKDLVSEDYRNILVSEDYRNILLSKLSKMNEENLFMMLFSNGILFGVLKSTIDCDYDLIFNYFENNNLKMIKWLLKVVKYNINNKYNNTNSFFNAKYVYKQFIERLFDRIIDKTDINIFKYLLNKYNKLNTNIEIHFLIRLLYKSCFENNTDIFIYLLNYEDICKIKNKLNPEEFLYLIIWRNNVKIIEEVDNYFNRPIYKNKDIDLLKHKDKYYIEGVYGYKSSFKDLNLLILAAGKKDRTFLCLYKLLEINNRIVNYCYPEIKLLIFSLIFGKGNYNSLIYYLDKNKELYEIIKNEINNEIMNSFIFNGFYYCYNNYISSIFRHPDYDVYIRKTLEEENKIIKSTKNQKYRKSLNFMLNKYPEFLDKFYDELFYFYYKTTKNDYLNDNNYEYKFTKWEKILVILLSIEKIGYYLMKI